MSHEPITFAPDPVEPLLIELHPVEPVTEPDISELEIVRPTGAEVAG